MKKFLFISLLISHFSFSQIGANYGNLDIYGDSISMEWMVQASTDTLPIRLRYDRSQQNIVDQVLLDKAKMFHRICSRNGKVAEFCFVLNAWATPQNNLIGVTQLVNYGCYIPIMEVFNEYYSKTTPKMNFSGYKAVFEPITTLIRNTYPNLIFAYAAAPRPIGIIGGRNDATLYNNDLAAYIQVFPKDAVIWHAYYNIHDCSILADTALVPQLYNPAILNQYLNNWYTIYYNCAMSSSLWSQIYDYTKIKYPGRKIFFTEFGTEGSSAYRDTWAYAAIVYRDMCKWQYTTGYRLYIHAGINGVGVISPLKGQYEPPQPTANVRRVEYWAVQLANKKPQTELKITNPILKEGIYTYWFVNDGAAYTPTFTLAQGLEIEYKESEFVKGNWIYSVGGYTGWMLIGGVKVQEITGTTKGNNVPELSFGIYTVKVNKNCINKTFYYDQDNDGFGSDSSVLACEQPIGYSENTGDCNDLLPFVFPGAIEKCNLVDDDCDGLVDENVKTTFYQDLDGDGYGSSIFTTACTQPTGFVGIPGDCNDSDASYHPGASEPCGLDKNCDGITVSCPIDDCYKKSGFYFLNKKCVKSTYPKCNCPN